MDMKLLQKIDGMIEERRQTLADDIIRLVNINSVKGDPMPGAPFGEGAKKVLDTAIKMGESHGLTPRDYRLGVASVAYTEGEIDLGMWVHGDVVPVGDGWNFEPFNAVEYKGCIVGRGANDNKGQLAAIMHLLAIFKELDIKLNYNPALFIGSNEESGMADLIGNKDIPEAEGFLNKYKAPKLSLVADSGFPVGYGGKGGMDLKLIAKTPWDGVSFTAGKNESPGRGEVFVKAKGLPYMEKCTLEEGEDGTLISAETPPIHSSKPNPEGNMVTLLADALIKSGILSENDKKKAEFLRIASLDVKGEFFNVAHTEPGMVPLSFALMKVEEADGKPQLVINIRYPLGITFEEICERVDKVAQQYGFELSYSKKGLLPYKLDPQWDVVQTLNKICNDVIGNDSKPYTLSGGTYGHRLPNALVYGISGAKVPEDFKPGYGLMHGIDEVASLELLQRGMRIYARALLALNEMEW